jgi:hypothetical protein
LQEFTLTYDLDYTHHAAPVFEDVLYEEADGSLEPGRRFTGDFDSSKNLKITIHGPGESRTWARKILADPQTTSNAKGPNELLGNQQRDVRQDLDDPHVSHSTPTDS